MDFDDAPTTEFTRDEATTPFWREARDEWEQRDNDETAAATPRAKDRHGHH